ncbi:MAG: ubiquinone/menaquinone biosynthesis methyltransferase [Phycisphaerales bacterium]|nr:ubiquinone/menaquinone biosynthesis methyltransferase [Phycisphaerales bacterium]
MKSTHEARPAAAWTATDLQSNPHDAADKARRVESMFTAIAPRYDLNNRLHSLWRDQAWRRATVALAAITPTDDVIDMACGTGDLTELLAQAGPRSIVGMDFTEAMLGVARRKATRRPMGSQPIEYRQGDAMNIDLPADSCDVVTIAFGIRNVDDPGGAAAEFARVLRPGGRLLVLEFSTPANPLMRFLNACYTRHVMPLTAGLLAGDRSGAYRYLPRSVSTFADPVAMADMLREVGFTIAGQHPLTFGTCTITVAHTSAV